FGARGKLWGYLLLGAPQNEGINQFAQILSGFLVSLFLDGCAELGLEVIQAAHQTWMEKSKLRPQLHRRVFHRCAGERQAMAAAQGASCSSGLRRRIFNGL